MTRDPSSVAARLQRSGEFSAFVIHQGGSEKLEAGKSTASTCIASRAGTAFWILSDLLS